MPHTWISAQMRVLIRMPSLRRELMVFFGEARGGAVGKVDMGRKAGVGPTFQDKIKLT